MEKSSKSLINLSNFFHAKILDISSLNLGHVKNNVLDHLENRNFLSPKIQNEKLKDFFVVYSLMKSSFGFKR